MSRNDWVVDLGERKITHATSGFFVQFEGDPTSDNCEGRPGKFPDGLKALEKVRLVREAFDYYIEAFQAGRRAAHAAAVPARSEAIPPRSTVVSTKPRLSLRKTS